jgi:hypothetical protein
VLSYEAMLQNWLQNPETLAAALGTTVDQIQKITAEELLQKFIKTRR